MSAYRPKVLAGVGLGVGCALAVVSVGIRMPASAQPAPAVVRLALLPQWVLGQHGVVAEGRVEVRPELRQALDGGLVDRVVFHWQRGVIQREVMVRKPVRVLPPGEASTLGGRGAFDLREVRQPTGRSAWTEVEIASRAGGADDVLVLEVGGELGTITQVLETLLVMGSDGGFQRLPLVRRALVSSPGVPVLRMPPGRPPEGAEVAGLPSGVGQLAFLVARSPVEVVVNGAVTLNGPADLAAPGSPGWQEGDRVFLRVPLGQLRAARPAIVLGWKDRTFTPDPDGGEGLRRMGVFRPAPSHGRGSQSLW